MSVSRAGSQRCKAGLWRGHDSAPGSHLGTPEGYSPTARQSSCGRRPRPPKVQQGQRARVTDADAHDLVPSLAVTEPPVRSFSLQNHLHDPFLYILIISLG